MQQANVRMLLQMAACEANDNVQAMHVRLPNAIQVLQPFPICKQLFFACSCLQSSS